MQLAMEETDCFLICVHIAPLEKRCASEFGMEEKPLKTNASRQEEPKLSKMLWKYFQHQQFLI